MEVIAPYSGWPRLDVANLIATLVETILLGHYLSLLFRTYEAMLRRSKEARVLLKSPLFWVSLLMFASILGSWITGVALGFKAFVLKSDVVYILGPDQAAGQEILPSVRQYLDLSDPWNVANTSFYSLGTCVCNAFIIYRLHIVWSRRWNVIVPPLVMLVAVIVTASMAIRHFSQSPDSSVYTAAGPWVTASFAVTLGCNLYSTGLIMWRIHQSNRSMRSSGTEKFGQSLTQRVSDMLIQSASLYSAFLTISLITYAAGSNLVFISIATTMPIIGISFCMIVMRAQRTAKGHPPGPLSRPSFRHIKIEYEKHVTVDHGVGQAPIKEVDVTDSEGTVPASQSPRRQRDESALEREESEEWPTSSSPDRHRALKLGGPV